MTTTTTTMDGDNDAEAAADENDVIISPRMTATFCHSLLSLEHDS